MFFCQIDGAPAAFQRCSDRDDASDARIVRATQHVVEIVGEIRIIEMRVGVDEHRLIVGRFCETPTSGSASAAADALQFYHSIIVLAQVSPPPNTINKT